MRTIRAIELFSGIGAFAAASRNSPIEIVAAFDQNHLANQVYEANFGLRPCARNLESIGRNEIPDADLWWMSPPCTPFSRKGRRRDAADPRARPLLHLVDLVGEVRPAWLLLENVAGFSGSESEGRLLRCLDAAGYVHGTFPLEPLDFGVPMRRPRIFLVATRERETSLELRRPIARPFELISSFLEPAPDGSLFLDDKAIAQWGRVFDVVDPEAENRPLTCVTRSYLRSPVGGGSLLRTRDGRLRRLSPNEIVALLGFPPSFVFPSALSRDARYRLAGNSVDVRAIRLLVETLLETRVQSSAA